VVDEEDIELMAEFGMSGLQKGRLARLIEEAYFQGAILDTPRLVLLLLETHRAIRVDLSQFWQAGAWLPIAGMKGANREMMRTLRGALAIDRYLAGEDLAQIRRELAIRLTRWHRWWQDFKELVRQEINPGSTQPLIAQPPEVLAAWQEVWKKHQEQPGLISRLALDKDVPGVSSIHYINRSAFYDLLGQRHGYSPAAADKFLDDLNDLAARLNRQARSGGQIIYNAVADHEPAGRKLAECQLKPVVLDYLDAQDWAEIDRDRTAELKWSRLLRLATQARTQGAVLTQPDLALLLGLSTKAIQSLSKEYPNVIIPTKGIVADMGPALTQVDKIVRLYMDGYTETEIVRRTGHSYDSVENYLLDFARVVYLVEKGLPVPTIRKVLGCSKKLVEKHVNLYREFSGPDYAFMLGRIRRLAEAHPVKKN
jgi:hypothetical protein